jgi:hypothetical protein
LAEIASRSKADRRKQLTFPNEVGELPASVRWEVQEGAILENNSIGVTERIASDYSDGTRDAQRLERTKATDTFRRGWLNLTDCTRPVSIWAWPRGKYQISPGSKSFVSVGLSTAKSPVRLKLKARGEQNDEKE